MAVSIVPCAVISTTGRRGWVSCSCRTRSRPPNPGKRRSVNTTSHSSLLARRNPSSPRLHTVTLKPSSFSTSHKFAARLVSSSIRRIRAVSRTPGNVVDLAPQDNAEGRAVAGPGLILEHAAVLFNDAGGNRQAEASPGLLGAEERVEKAFLDFGRDALAVIDHLKNNGFCFIPA